MADQYGNLSPEDYAQQQQINRQQRLATMLMSQNQQPQGQMVSGRYVAPSFFQNLQPVANMLTGAYLSKQGDTQQQQLAEAIRGREAKETQKILGLQFGSPDYKPAVMPQIQRDDMGNVMPVVEQQVGQAPDQKQALVEALKSQGRTGQMIGQTLLAQKLKPPEQFNLRENEKRFTYNPDTGTTTEIAKGNPKEIKYPNEIELALSLDRSLPRDPATWTQADADRADARIIRHIKEKRPLNINSTTVLGGETEYNKAFGKELASQDITLKSMAENAPQTLANIKRQQNILEQGNVITGFGADQRLDLARFGQALGLTGKNVVKDTQQLFAGRASSLLDSVKASGLGTGNGFTDKDLKFLEKAKLGGITYDPATLKEQLAIEAIVTRNLVNRYNERVKDMPVAGNLRLKPIVLPQDSNEVFSAADAIINKKKTQ
jgi:hypothetical protein